MSIIKLFRYLINTLLCAALITLFVIFLLPRFFGYQPYMVVSASMQQSFPVGSLIFVRDAVRQSARQSARLCAPRRGILLRVVHHGAGKSCIRHHHSLHSGAELCAEQDGGSG